MCPICSKTFKNGKKKLDRHLVKLNCIPAEASADLNKNSSNQKINNQFINLKGINILVLLEKTLREEDQKTTRRIETKRGRKNTKNGRRFYRK